MKYDRINKSTLVANIKAKIERSDRLRANPSDLNEQLTERQLGERNATTFVHELWQDCHARILTIKDAAIEKAALPVLFELNNRLEVATDLVISAEARRLRQDTSDVAVTTRIQGYLTEPYEELHALLESLEAAMLSISISGDEARLVPGKIKALDAGLAKAEAAYTTATNLQQANAKELAIRVEAAKTEIRVACDQRFNEWKATATQQLDGFSGVFRNLCQSAGTHLEKLTELERLQGVAKFSDSFANRGNKVGRLARIWLFGGIVTLALAACTPFLLPVINRCLELPDPQFADWTPSAFEHIGKRTVIVFALLGFSAYCLRNYRVQRSLREDYKHRQLALETFNTFKVFANEPAAKDRVLLWACRMIFSTPTSASSAKAADGMQPDPELVAKILAQLKG